MKKQLHVLMLVFALLGGTLTQAQVTIKTEAKEKLEQLSAQKSRVQEEEKAYLKKQIERIEQMQAENKITAAEAQRRKEAAAQKSAQNIASKMLIIEEQMALINRNSDDYKATELTLGIGLNSDEEKNKQYDEKDAILKRTTSGFTMAFGLSNALIDGSIDDSPYKIAGSRFFELGYEWQTVLDKNAWLRLRYGASLQFNGLKPEDNLYFVEDGDQTVLEEFPVDLDKAKLRMDNLVFPVHLEFGKAHKYFDKGTASYTSTDKFKMGLGGFVGVNLNTIQKLKFEENGKNRKEKRNQSYNTNNFLYGLSAYIGYDSVSLYARYELNTVFKDNAIDQNAVSLGLRFSF